MLKELRLFCSLNPNRLTMLMELEFVLLPESKQGNDVDGTGVVLLPESNQAYTVDGAGVVLLSEPMNLNTLMRYTG